MGINESLQLSCLNLISELSSLLLSREDFKEEKVAFWHEFFYPFFDELASDVVFLWFNHIFYSDVVLDLLQVLDQGLLMVH